MITAPKLPPRAGHVEVELPDTGERVYRPIAKVPNNPSLDGDTQLAMLDMLAELAYRVDAMELAAMAAENNTQEG